MSLMQMPPDVGQGGALAQWLQALRLVAPPRGLLHVGAGRTNPGEFSALHAVYSHAAQVLALEADASRAAQLQETFASQPQVKVQQALVAPRAGRVAMKHASISEESGMYPPELLHSVWPRLQTVHEEELDAIAIGDCWLAPEAAEKPLQPDSAAPNWLFVDCHPAAELLQQVPQLLAGMDVVVARAVDASRLAGNTPAVPDQVSLAQLQKLLGKQRLHLLGIHEENHPALVLAVFARDQVQRVSQQRVEADRLQAEIDRLRGEARDASTQRDALSQEVASAKADSLRARNEKTAAQRALEDQLAQLQQLVKSGEEQAKQRQQQIEQLNKHRAELTQQTTDLRSRLAQLEKREEALSQEMREARQTASLSLKLQSLREADLKDLQARFQSSAAVQERQHELLTKLTERLRVASAYLHQLTASGFETPAVGTDARGQQNRQPPRVRSAKAAAAPARKNGKAPKP